MTDHDPRPDPTTPTGMLAAMVARHPELNWHPDARAAAALHTQLLLDRALKYTFSGAAIPRDDRAPHSH